MTWLSNQQHLWGVHTQRKLQKALHRTRSELERGQLAASLAGLFAGFSVVLLVDENRGRRHQ